MLPCTLYDCNRLNNTRVLEGKRAMKRSTCWIVYALPAVFLITAICLLQPECCMADSGGWTWMGGADAVEQAGVYGTKGVPDASNVPGSRFASVSWSERMGHVWLFGGYGSNKDGSDDILLNDLWQYDIATGEWTWMSGSDAAGHENGVYGSKGIADAANVPGSRYEGVSWTDSAGHLWLFGGAGMDGAGEYGILNDLWRYDPGTNQWTWMSGSNLIAQAGVYGTRRASSPANVPGARWAAVTWTDRSGNLWLFGGFGMDGAGSFGRLNDLWCYDPAANEWTWMSGSNTTGQSGVYGVKGTPDAANVPGARFDSISWTDSTGNLWLFGGSVNQTMHAYFNDLWSYDPVTNEWTWMSGSDTFSQSGVYGVKGAADAANVPGARCESISWTDSTGNLWLFGGVGFDSRAGDSAHWGLLNDLWVYDPGTGLWAWMSGSDRAWQFGVYGVKGTADSVNVPGSRAASIALTDNAGSLWLFGGSGSASTGSGGALNDLWRYETPECILDSDCGHDLPCIDGMCMFVCELLIRHKPIRSAKLTKPRKVVLHISGGDDFDVFGHIDIGPLGWKKVTFNIRKNRIKVLAVVPAGLESGVVPISVGDCVGEIGIQ